VFQLVATVINQYLIHEEIKSRLNLGNECYHSVQKLLSSHLLSKNINIKIHKTIILYVVLYGFETWSLTLREEQRMKVFENRVLRGTSGPKRTEIIDSWRKLHNDELHNLHSLPYNYNDEVEVDEMGGACRILVGKPERKRRLGRSRQS
jgi:hypothetical protein